MAASAWVASSGLCLRMSPITSSSWSRSSFEVLAVAAMAGGGPDLRAGVGAVTRCRTGGAGLATGGESGAPTSRPGAVAGEAGVVFGTTLCATVRAVGSGGLPFAVFSPGFSAACFAVGLSAACLAVDFSVAVVAGLAADFSVAGLAVGFSVDFFDFSAAFFAAGFTVVWAAVDLSVSASAESPSASVRLAANTVDSAVDRRGDARKSRLKSGPSRANRSRKEAT